MNEQKRFGVDPNCQNCNGDGLVWRLVHDGRGNMDWDNDPCDHCTGYNKKGDDK